MYSLICAQWLELCVQTSARIFIATADCSLRLTQPRSKHKVSQLSWVWVPSVGYTEKLSLRGVIHLPVSGQDELPVQCTYFSFFFECRGSLGSLPALDEMSDLSMADDW